MNPRRARCLVWGLLACGALAAPASAADAPDAPEASDTRDPSPPDARLDPAEQALAAARVLAEAGQLAAAERTLQAALVTLPHHHDLVFGLAQVLRWQGQAARALEQLDRALALDPRSLDALLARGELLALQAEFAAAQAVVARLEEVGAPDAAVDGLKLSILLAQGRGAAARREARAFEQEHGGTEQTHAASRGPRGVRIGVAASVELRLPRPRVDWGIQTHLNPNEHVRAWLAYAGSTWLADQEHAFQAGLHLISRQGLSFVVAGGGAWPGVRFARAQGELGFGVRTRFKLELEVGLALRVYGAAASTVVLGRLGARQPFTEQFALRAAVTMALIKLADRSGAEPAPGLQVTAEIRPRRSIVIEVGYSIATELVVAPGGAELQELLIHRVPASMEAQLDPRFSLKIGGSLEVFGAQPPFPRFEIGPTLHL